MPKPPPPPPRPKSPSLPDLPPKPEKPGKAKGAEPLAEVERALSVLQGRHPDAVRTERETTAALAAKKAAADARDKTFNAEDTKRWVGRGLLGALVLAVVGAAVGLYSHRAGRGRSVEEALAPKLAPYLAHGWARVSPGRFAQEEVALDAAEPTCFMAFASRAPGDGNITIDRLAGALEGADSVAWCACGAEQATVRLHDPRAGGLAVLSVAAPQIGGDHGLFFVEPLAHVIAPPNECSHASLDAWLEKGAVVSPKEDALDSQTKNALKRVGFEVAGSAAPGRPFAVLPPQAESCALALSTVPADLLSLRLPGGERAVSDVKGPLAFCANKAATVTVWRKGKGELVVERIDANRVGGRHGLSAALARMGLGSIDAWLPEDDVAWDASATLRATGVVPAEISGVTDGAIVKAARVIALSLAGAVAKVDAINSLSYLCEPPLTDTSKTALCAEATGLSWHQVGDVGKSGIAEAPLPFWLQAFAGPVNHSGLTLQLSLLKLAERLTLEGFEPTTLDGVTETDDGAKVNGRGGSDAIVAVQLTHEDPWVSPCSEGAAWTLDHDPVVVPLQAGAQSTLSCVPKVAKASDRRTVVFRHALARHR